MKLRRSLLQDVVEVETYTGEGARGPQRNAPVAVRCMAETATKLVRNGDGDEVVSTLTLTCHPGIPDTDTPPAEPLFKPESLVTYRDRTSAVIGVRPVTDRGRLVMLLVDVA